jgi:hypothetical protein
MLKCFSSAGCCSQAEDPVREEPAPFRVNVSENQGPVGRQQAKRLGFAKSLSSLARVSQVADVCSELGSLEGSWLDKARGATTVLSSGLGLGMVRCARLVSNTCCALPIPVCAK